VLAGFGFFKTLLAKLPNTLISCPLLEDLSSSSFVTLLEPLNRELVSLVLLEPQSSTYASSIKTNLGLLANQVLQHHALSQLEFMLVSLLSFLPHFTTSLFPTTNKQEKRCKLGFSDDP